MYSTAVIGFIFDPVMFANNAKTSGFPPNFGNCWKFY